jgi:hypothetical protein
LAFTVDNNDAATNSVAFTVDKSNAATTGFIGLTPHEISPLG